MIAFTIEGAAAATPFSRELIREAINTGDLIAHYRPGGVHPIIIDDDLRDWIRTLPTSPAR